MSVPSRPRSGALLDFPLGAGYLIAGLLPALVPEPWRPAVVAMAEVSLAAAVAVPLLGAAMQRLSPDPRLARRRVLLLAAIVCVLLPQVQLFRHPDALPQEFLAPLLPALTALVPLLAIVVGALFFGLLWMGWSGPNALIVLIGLTLPAVALARNLFVRRLARSTGD